ncbi:MAG: hypothetical protein NC328_04715 [Muribaculum sp.]|nr:hypothetical protein [Muribaculum sp.]
MKKIFTLLAVALLGVGFVQAKQVDANKIKFEGAKVALDQMQPQSPEVLQQLSDQGKIEHRSWVTNNYIYDTYFAGLGTLVDVLGFTMKDEDDSTQDRPAVFEDLPYYAVQVQMLVYRRSDPNNPVSIINMFTTWPCKGSATTGMDSDWDLSTPELRKIMTIEEILSTTGCPNDFMYYGFVGDDMISANFFPQANKDGELIAWPIWSNIVGVTSTVNGVSGLQLQSDDPQTGADWKQKSMFTIDKYDGATKEMTMPFELYFTNPQDPTASIAPQDGTYIGEVNLIDMWPVDYKYDFTQLHIFNAGISNADQTNAEGELVWQMPFGYPEVDTFAPVQGYYIYGISCGDIVVDINPNDKVPFDRSKIKFTMSQAEQQVESNWNQGEFFVWTNSDTYENQTYTTKEVVTVPYQFGNTTINLYTCNPEAGIMIPGGNPSDQPFEGLFTSRVVASAYYKYMLNGSYIATNTEDGLVLDGRDLVGNTFKGSFNGKAVYHYDKDNMNNTREVSINGTYVPEISGVASVAADENFAVAAQNGVITVVSGEAADVKVFNLSGAVVGAANVAAGVAADFNVEHGIYIVKVGKAAKKVIL